MDQLIDGVQYGDATSATLACFLTQSSSPTPPPFLHPGGISRA